MKNIVCSRPMGSINLDITPTLNGVEITRSASGIFAPAPTTLELPIQYDKAVSQLTSWANGEVAQVALKDWSIQFREWIITGMVPGSDMNPYHH